MHMPARASCVYWVGATLLIILLPFPKIETLEIIVTRFTFTYTYIWYIHIIHLTSSLIGEAKFSEDILICLNNYLGFETRIESPQVTTIAVSNAHYLWEVNYILDHTWARFFTSGRVEHTNLDTDALSLIDRINHQMITQGIGHTPVWLLYHALPKK